MTLEWKRANKTGTTNDWLVYRTDTNARGFWLVKQHDWPIEQCLLHIRIFFGGKTKRPCFDLFIHWLIKQITNTYGNHFSRSYENRSTYRFHFVTFLECGQESWCKLSNCPFFSAIFWLPISLPIQTGFNGSCAPESATNPFAHSHLYDPMVLLQTSLAPQASRDWHSSKSTKVKKNMHSSWNEEKPSKLFVSCLV